MRPLKRYIIYTIDIFELIETVKPSVSRKNLALEIGSPHNRLECDLRRHLSPRTVGIIIRSLPLRGNAHKMGEKITYIETSIDSGLERARTAFKKGDIAFLPSTGSVCFFLEDANLTKKMTPLGRLSGNIKLLESAASGTVLSIKKE